MYIKINNDDNFEFKLRDRSELPLSSLKEGRHSFTVYTKERKCVLININFISYHISFFIFIRVFVFVVNTNKNL